jgi:3-methyladenine DNA glycosylase/8-oxoguanine DNA glycosylase
MNNPLQLALQHSVELTPPPPFLFDATFHKPDHFPSADTAWEPGARRQTMRWRGLRLGLVFRNRGAVDAPCLSLDVWAEAPLTQAALAALVAEIRYRYNLDLDLASFHQQFAQHPTLGPILTRWRGMRPMHAGSLYEYLIIAIMLQNTAVRRSIAMLQALFARYGSLLQFDGHALYCFWTPEELAATATEEEMRSLKIGYRARSVLRVTQAFAAGQIDEHALRAAPYAEQRSALLALYGIGPASVGYILADVFHHLDEMAHISPWEQRIYSKLFFDADPDTTVDVPQIIAWLDANFAPWRWLAVHYVWEDLFWQRKHAPVDWLERLIRL